MCKFNDYNFRDQNNNGLENGHRGVLERTARAETQTIKKCARWKKKFFFSKTNRIQLCIIKNANNFNLKDITPKCKLNNWKFVRKKSRIIFYEYLSMWFFVLVWAQTAFENKELGQIAFLFDLTETKSSINMCEKIKLLAINYVQIDSLFMFTCQSLGFR